MGASLLAKWQRIHLPVQETRDPSLVQEAPTCAKHLSPCTTTTEPVLWGPGTATTKPTHDKAWALQWEKPPQWEVHASQLESSPCSLLLEKTPTVWGHSEGHVVRSQGERSQEKPDHPHLEPVASRTVRNLISILWAPPSVATCYRLNVFLLKSHTLRPNPHCVGIRRWGHQEVIGSWG